MLRFRHRGGTAAARMRRPKTVVRPGLWAQLPLFQTYTPAQIGAFKKGTVVRTAFVTLAATLDADNNGLTGPGHCSE